ncbi:cyclic nucleotide-binding domain-containing protein [Sediminibacillus dalangtanensis]|uniref:Cyclic nucleotide-binding domain-containing protein n=1 Tax=Sediminibacillus dalangtanensis TaxID=2729421 RepID=A0ABX7VTB7_9BACI|nr:cyclic nucleotide-binding domain-containing protein [Sediminibacillus dalangtanensis]QTM99758.1 cyclic nucleotide-binding domain-containing protein [Sediminibacillus dalangtanensis]
MKLTKRKHLEDKWKYNYETLSAYGEIGEVGESQLIYSFEQPAHAVYFITSGFVRLFNKETCRTKIIGAGEFFGDRSVFFTKHMYVESVTPVVFVRVDEESYSRLMKHEPKLAVELITHISKNHIYLTEKQSLLSETKELFSQLKKGYSKIHHVKKSDHQLCCHCS